MGGQRCLQGKESCRQGAGRVTGKLLPAPRHRGLSPGRGGRGMASPHGCSAAGLAWARPALAGAALDSGRYLCHPAAGGGLCVAYVLGDHLHGESKSTGRGGRGCQRDDTDSTRHLPAAHTPWVCGQAGRRAGGRSCTGKPLEREKGVTPPTKSAGAAAGSSITPILGNSASAEITCSPQMRRPAPGRPCRGSQVSGGIQASGGNPTPTPPRSPPSPLNLGVG